MEFVLIQQVVGFGFGILRVAFLFINICLILSEPNYIGKALNKLRIYWAEAFCTVLCSV
jgi:hypothetical protein